MFSDSRLCKKVIDEFEQKTSFVYCRHCFDVVDDIEVCPECKSNFCEECMVECTDCDNVVRCFACSDKRKTTDWTRCCSMCGESLCLDCGYYNPDAAKMDEEDIWCKACMNKWTKGRKRRKTQ